MMMMSFSERASDGERVSGDGGWMILPWTVRGTIWERKALTLSLWPSALLCSQRFPGSGLRVTDKKMRPASPALDPVRLT